MANTITNVIAFIELILLANAQLFSPLVLMI